MGVQASKLPARVLDSSLLAEQVIVPRLPSYIRDHLSLTLIGLVRAENYMCM